MPETEGENVGSVLMDPGDPLVEISDDSMRVIDALQTGYRAVERRGHEINEAETRQLLIAPVLDALGFPANHRRPEDGDRGNRPDELCYDREVEPNLVEAAIILEAKALNCDFDVPEQLGSRVSSPDRQIQRYLRQHVASGPSTLGVLTDGVRWRLYERFGSDVSFVEDYDFGRLARQFWRSASSFNADVIEEIEAFTTTARRCFESPAPLVLAPRVDGVVELLKLVSAGGSPTEILSSFAQIEEIEPRHDIDDQVTLTGLLEDTFENDWEEHAYVIGPEVAAQGQLSLSDQLTIGVVKFAHSEWGLGRGDTAASARILARAAGSNMSVMFIYSEGRDGSCEARVAACADGQVNMTAAFDPELPLPSARAAIGRIIAKLSSDRPLAADDILGPLEVMPLRQQFYREVSKWTWELQRDQDSEYRHAVLKHLIRVIFTWILKEEGIIPPELFEYAYVANHLGDHDAYHSEVLQFLFHERLNVLEDVRTPHDVSSLNEMLDRAPFLNGSLFAKQTGEPDLNIPLGRYWDVDEDAPGLFTIFNRYHWTTDEHRPGESEQTMDPELLSNLFEQLITPTEEGSEPPPRQPQGTYYTPADVADEMVKDALSAAVEVRAPDVLDSEELLRLFGDADEPLPVDDPTAKASLSERIKSLRIFDPAVGSGEFLFSCLIAIKTALIKLNGDDPNLTREIIKGQLAGQDISPLATQITRLRLFIAIVSAEKGDPSREPLPNLEARVVCADSLETVADPSWRPDRASALGDFDAGFAGALGELASNRKRWFDAHSEEEKSELREEDEALRAELNSYLGANGNDTVVSPEFRGFVEFPLLGTGLECARTDPRLLFYEPDWRGFDIVIGNPPYERLSISVDDERKANLVDEKGYRTTNVNDLYTLFCEMGLALARQNGGVVTMIVPLSIAFGQRQRTVRAAFEERAKQVSLRHYDIRPATIFKESFSVRLPENSQRATILTARLGESNRFSIKTTGLQRWSAAERETCLRRRSTIEVSEIDGLRYRQWPRVPTREVAELVIAIRDQRVDVLGFESNDGVAISIPEAPRYYITVLPNEIPRTIRCTEFQVADDDARHMLVAALNSHVAYAWWRVYGDGFHAKLSDYERFAVPNAWMDDPSPAIDLGKRLIANIDECATTEISEAGPENYNLHLRPDLMGEIDSLFIEGLGLDVEPLLFQLKTMRSNSTWDIT